MHISLRAGERLFLNGAVLRVDRKVTLELLNDATFLLENHVLQVEDTKTPIRQLYFAVQAMLMDPANAAASRALFEAMARDVAGIFRSQTLKSGIEEALRQVAAERPFHALKTLRSLFAEEAEVLAGASAFEELPQPVAAPAAPAKSETEEDTAFAAVGEPRRAIAANLPSH
ncbi:flagellar biosynthesis repressor FlbT [Acuticoccus sp. I52.16.1]|uniref:flagellar biosynthesis repressor FlbT n=1 Tax=Acuticoccus sp. I52.16.1 TaxID=2928472 RepID=UPI001FD62053|nr:flagellar biosynthesis repressor FlbT [Acuticoccus sp. I52.16.1]UOM34940.1 flagellar biosynthesis repressor FlbT [Acuticoccus sp. I52.16.1]